MSEIWTTDALADWSVSLDPAQLPDAVIAKAEDCVLDAIACAMIGRASPATQAVETMACGIYRNGPAKIWFSSDVLAPIGAAFVNAATAIARLAKMDAEGLAQALGVDHLIKLLCTPMVELQVKPRGLANG